MHSLMTFAVAAVTVLSALAVVRTRNLVHAVLWLGLSLLGTAVLYALLGQPFLAGVQVLTYVGGIVTLMVFGVMVTGRQGEGLVVAESKGKLRAALTAAGFFTAVAFAVWRTPLPAVPGAGLRATTVEQIGTALFGRYLLPFELASVLLLAAIVGSVALARRRDVETPAAERQRRAALFTARVEEPTS